MTLVATHNALFINPFTMVFSMTVAAGHFLIRDQLFKQGEIVVVKILSLFIFLSILFHSAQEGMAGLTEFLLVINGMGTMLAPMLSMAEKTIAF